MGKGGGRGGVGRGGVEEESISVVRKMFKRSIFKIIAELFFDVLLGVVTCKMEVHLKKIGENYLKLRTTQVIHLSILQNLGDSIIKER